MIPLEWPAPVPRSDSPEPIVRREAARSLSLAAGSQVVFPRAAKAEQGERVGPATRSAKKSSSARARKLFAASVTTLSSFCDVAECNLERAEQILPEVRAGEESFKVCSAAEARLDPFALSSSFSRYRLTRTNEGTI